MIIGEKIIYHANVSSTNDAATALLNIGKVDEGTVISAGFQSEGKGQRNNVWHSQPFMNLIMSVILRPNVILPEEQFYLSKIVSLGILDVLKEYSGDFSIKWPNDIYHGGDKIAGILIEHSILGRKISGSIAGIGLNINQTEFPEEISNPVSLAIISGKSHNVQDLQDDICARLQDWYLILKERDLLRIDRAYEDNLYLKGIEAEFITGDGSLTGTILGVNSLGQLKILSTEGVEKLFSFKEIEFMI